VVNLSLEVRFSGWAKKLREYDYQSVTEGAVMIESWTEEFTYDGRIIKQSASQRRLVT
jgi:hypothetical protein